MSLFKFMLYCLFVYLSIVGLPVHAQPVANPETTDSTITVTPQWIEEQRQVITKAQAALQANKQALPKKISNQMLEEAASLRQAANQKVEELRVQRVERQSVQDNLDKKTARLTEFQTTLNQLTQFPRAEQTLAQNKRISAVKKDVALYKQAVELEQQSIELFKTQTELAIKQTLFAIEWHSQLQTVQQNNWLKEQKQVIADAQTALDRQQETLQTAQAELPNKIATLETAESTFEILKKQFEKAALDKQIAALEVKNLDLERQSAQTNLDNQLKNFREPEEKLENLRKTPPVEEEHKLLHEKRIAVFDNKIELQKQALELEQQQFDILKLRLEQAHKRLALSTQWYDKLQPVYRHSQKQALKKQIQQERQRYVDRAAKLRQQLDLIPALEENIARRYLLGVQIQKNHELADWVGRQLEIRDIQEQLQRWQKMAKALQENTNTAVFHSQLDNTKAVITELNALLPKIQASEVLLQSKMAFLEEQQELVKERRDIFSGNALKENTKAQKLLTKLKSILQQELEQIPPLLKEGNELLALLENSYKDNMHRALLRQRVLPESAVQWWSLFKEVGTIPSLIMQLLQHTWRGFTQAFQQTSNQRWFLLCIVTLVWLSVVLGVSAWTTRIFEGRGEARSRLVEHLVVGLRLLHKNILSIAVTGVFLLFIWLTLPNQLSTLVTLFLLLTFLGGKLLINLSELLLGDSTGNQIRSLNKLSFFNKRGFLPRFDRVLATFLSVPDLKSQNTIKLYRQLRWTIIVLGLLTVITALSHLEHKGQVRLSLTARDLIDSVFMVLLSLTILPFMRVRQLILTWVGTRTEGYWLLVIKLITLLLPVAILAVSILGVVGYISLGWTVASYLSVFLLVLTGWLIARGFLNDLMILWKNLVLKHSHYGSLWAEDLIPLGHKLLSLVLFGLAVIALMWLTGWYSDVAIKESIGQVFNFPLVTFKSGEQITVIDVFVSILIIWAVFWLGSWSRRITYRWVFLRITDTGIRHSLSVFIQYVIVLVGLLIVLKAIGIDPTAFTVFAGAIGIGIGFGMQNVVSNFISGILLLVERPVRTGDLVEINGHVGHVSKIGIRSLILRKRDKTELVVPNSDLISNAFSNWTHSDKTYRLSVFINVSYDDDLHFVQKILMEAVGELPEILSKPAHKVLLWEFTDFAAKFRVDCYIDPDFDKTYRSTVLFKIWDRLKAAGIKIPYPQQDMHIKLASNAQLSDGSLLVPHSTYSSPSDREIC